jgi:hypothetical protein
VDGARRILVIMTTQKIVRSLAFLAFAFGLGTTLALPGTPSESDAVAVTEVVQDHLHAKDMSTYLFQEKNYIVATWDAAGGHAAGSALAKQTPGETLSGWTIVRYTAGSLADATLLESLGVPAATAQALVKDLDRAKSP